MHPLRRKRLSIILLILMVIGLAAALVLYALRQNINLFYTPSQIVNNEAPQGVTIRIGGLVENGSYKQQGDSLKSLFKVTDIENSVTITYEGILPDLFKEGQGVVARGQLGQDRVFMAEEVLAKHDENYMPPEVKDALEQSGHWKDDQEKTDY